MSVEALTGLIKRAVSPGSWRDTGSSGTIKFFPMGMVLVRNQRPEIQEQIADLLNTLRRYHLHEPFKRSVDKKVAWEAGPCPIPCAELRNARPAASAVRCPGVCGVTSVPASFTSDLDIPIKNPTEKSGTASCPSTRPTGSQAEGEQEGHERCYGGGFRSMRGFQLSGVAPDANACPGGAGSMSLDTQEYRVPVLGNNQLYRVTFVDSGTVDCTAKVQEQRIAAGAGIRIVVPILGPVPTALEFGLPLKKPETAQGAYSPPPPPQCCPPSSAELHSAKTEPAKTCDCCTCCPKCCEAKGKQKRAHVSVIAPTAPVTYVPAPPMPPVMPCPPAVGVLATPMLAGPTPPAIPPAAPQTMIYSLPVSENVIEQCHLAMPVPPPALPSPSWTMRVAHEDGHACLAFQTGHDTCVSCPHMSVKMAHGEHLKVVASSEQIRMEGPGFRAMANSITKSNDAERFVLEGHVRLMYHKDGVAAEIAAERVFINMNEGHLAVQLGAFKSEAPAASKKDKLFQFWIGMCH